MNSPGSKKGVIFTSENVAVLKQVTKTAVQLSFVAGVTDLMIVYSLFEDEKMILGAEHIRAIH